MKTPVRSDLYSKEYYKTDNEGGNIFFNSDGKETSPRFKFLMNFANLKEGQRVLDVGCGRGEIVLQSAMKGMDATGIDYSSDSIELCKDILKKFTNLKGKAEFMQKDIKNLDFPNSYFDAVFMLDVIEHLHDWEIKQALDGINRIMNKWGVLIIHTTPNTDFYKYGYPIMRIFYPILRVIPSVRKLIETKPNWKGKIFLPKDPEEGQGYNKEGHVNEQNPASLRKYLLDSGFKSKIILVPFTRPANSIFTKIIYKILSLPLLRTIFCAEIVAVCKKLN